MLEINFGPFPQFDTARLHLREIVPSDAEVFYHVRRDPAVTAHLGRDNDVDIAAVHSLILKIRASFDQGDGIAWAINERGSDKLIGTINLWRIDKQNHRGEIGYMLSPMLWGKGYMSEAMEVVLHFAFHQIKLHSIEANTAVANKASHALLEKFGFIKEAHFRENWYHNGEFSDSIIYAKLTDLKQ